MSEFGIEDPYTTEPHHIDVEGDTGRPEVFIHIRRESVHGVDNVTLLRDTDAVDLYQQLGDYLDDTETKLPAELGESVEINGHKITRKKAPHSLVPECHCEKCGEWGRKASQFERLGCPVQKEAIDE